MASLAELRATEQRAERAWREASEERASLKRMRARNVVDDRTGEVPSAKRIAAHTNQVRNRRTAWKAARKRYFAAKRAQDDEPRVVRSGLRVAKLFGDIGPVVAWVGHYTAGPRDRSLSHALSLWKQYHEYHKRLGWGGIAYHVGITAEGVVVLLRPFSFKGAHVGGFNTGRVGAVMHGTGPDDMSEAQSRSLQWLLSNTRRLGAPVDLKEVNGSVHFDYSPTSCPGRFEPGYRRAA